MAETSPSLREKLLLAQTTAGVPPTEAMVPYRSIRELLEQQADRYDQKPFLISYPDDTGRSELCYAEFFEEVCKTANFLLASGIRPGDRVATVAVNHSDTVVQYFAAFVMGAVVVPINVGEDDRRIAFILHHSGCRLAFVRDRFLPRIASLLPDAPDLHTLVQVGRVVDPALPHYQTEILRSATRLVSPVAPNLHDEALMVYTSGTTGQPKGVVLSQYNLLVDAMAISEWHRLGDDQRMMCVLPIHHVNGLVVTLMTPLYAGGSVVLNEKFHVEKFFERISTEEVHVISVVPTLLQFLLHARLPLEGYKLGQVRHVICGAGPLTVELALKFELAFGIPVIHGYGLSETTCYSCFLPIDLSRGDHKMWLSRHGFPSIGVPLPVNEMAIHDAEGTELDEGSRGEIVIRGHNVMHGYSGNPDATGEAVAHGWFRSGDEGFFRYDDQGRKFFFITGRIKELIIRGGVNISPFEIDEVLMSLPGVAAGIAVGFENDWYGEEVGAFVILKAGVLLEADAVLAFCRKSLPFAKSPKVIVFGDQIPVTSTGKYQRSRCKELFSQWKEVQFSETGRSS
jgi:acyl-CoA synthetase (AMP-forming)/AMP-acid ligase II